LCICAPAPVLEGSGSFGMKTLSMCVAELRFLALVVCLMAPSNSLTAETTSRDLSGSPAVQPDPIQENFGARVAPYEGFLELPKESLPPGYVETSHHYTKREYLLRLAKNIGGNNFSIDIVESDAAQFFEPKDQPIKWFTYQGCAGRVFAYRDHLTGSPVLALYWMNAPKQRLSISVDQAPSNEWSPDSLIRLLEAMTTAKGEPALIPQPRQNFSTSAGLGQL